MAYRQRKRYRTRGEVLRAFYKKFKIVLWFLLIALVIYCWMNRISIIDYIKTYFY
jgi:hypothetical protein